MFNWLFKRVPIEMAAPLPIEKWKGVVVNDFPVHFIVVELESGGIVSMRVEDAMWHKFHVGDKVLGTKQGDKYTVSSARWQ